MLFLLEFQRGFDCGTALVLTLLDARDVGLEGGFESVAGVAAREERVVRRIGADVDGSRVDVLRVVRVEAGAVVLGVVFEVVAVELRVVREGRVAIIE